MSRLLFIGLVLLVAGSTILQGCARTGRAGARFGGAARRGVLDVGKPDAQAESFARYADAVISEMNGDLAAAMDSFAEAVAKDPGDEQLALDVTGRFLRYKQPERALEILTNAVALPSASGELFARLGFVHAQLGQTELAIQANRAAVGKSPTLLPAHQNLYLSYLQTKQEALALQVLDDAAQVPGADAEFLLGIAELYSNLGMVTPPQRSNAQARARSLLMRAAETKPTHSALRLKLADGLNQLGESARAIELYAPLLNEAQDNPSLRGVLRTKLADLYLRTRDRPRATEQLEAILRDDPMNAQATFILGSLAFEDKRMEQAADYFSRTVLLNPKFEQAYYDLVTAQLNLDRVEAALATLEKARALFEQKFSIEFFTGVVQAQRKDYAQALKHYTTAEVIAKAAEPHRLTYGFFFQVGIACERTGDFNTAVKCFEKCLELAPNADEAQNYLGYMWAERGTNLDRARELIEKAVKAEPDNEAYLDSLGWVLFKLGQPREALEPMLRSVKLAEKPDPTLYDHLGDIYTALGEPEKAREAWRKSLEIEASETVRKKLDASPPK